MFPFMFLDIFKYLQIFSWPSEISKLSPLSAHRLLLSQLGLNLSISTTTSRGQEFFQNTEISSSSFSILAFSSFFAVYSF